MPDETCPRYFELAERLAFARERQRLTQSELADLLGLKQQTVSRWEAGTHRPSSAQVAPLAVALGDNAEVLMRLAGHTHGPAPELLSPFPVEALNESTFEQFTADLVEALYRPQGVETMVYGSRGHKQDGTDVVATFPDKTRWSFQCKRVERFGKADVERAIAVHTFKATRCFLVISRPASPAAIEAVAEHDGWTLWDRATITRKVRELPGDTQDRLVDIYFRGRRRELLGRSEPGPWVQSKEFFAPYRGRSQVFHHDWEIIGRATEIQDVLSAVGPQSDARIALLVGPGGIGKSRVLKEVVERMESAHPALAVRLLSSSQELKTADLHDLGSGEKMLVVDDAHDRDSLGAVIEFAAIPENKARLLISTRPYAAQRIRNEISNVGIADVPTVSLLRLSRENMRLFAEAALTANGGDREWVDSVLSIASDSPLVAAMAARALARGGLPPELTRSEAELRQFVLGKFARVLTGDLGSPLEAQTVRNLLELLALLQPFHVDDRRIAELATAIYPAMTAQDVSRGLKLLIDGGVIYRRGHLYRLMPDLLGDFLIENSCIGADGKLTPFAEQVVQAVPSTQLTQVLVNLGRMDWRVSGGDPTDSALLDRIWADLGRIEYKYDQRHEAVEAVAYFQPAQALRYVETHLRAGRRFNGFAKILKRIAMTPEHRSAALELLWELGKNDPNEPDQFVAHPVRALADLLKFEQTKPLTFIEEIADFAFGLLDRPDAWDNRHSPLEILKPLLETQGTTTRATARAISLGAFFVDPQRVEHLRQRLIDKLFELLTHPRPDVGRKAAMMFNDALRPPYGMFNQAPPEGAMKGFTTQFEATANRLREYASTHPLSATTWLALIRSVNWHSGYDSGPVGDAVRELFRSAPTSLDFRFYAALTDVSDWDFMGQTPFDAWSKERAWSHALADELVAAYLPADLCLFVQDHLESMSAAGENFGMAAERIAELVARNPDVAEEIIRISEEDPTDRLCNYLGVAVGYIIDHDAVAGRARVRSMIASGVPAIAHGAARALINMKRPIDRHDIDLFKSMLSAEDVAIATIGLLALRSARDLPERKRIELILSAPVDRDPGLFLYVAMMLVEGPSPPVQRLASPDLDRLFSLMAHLSQLTGHWTEELLQQLAKLYGVRLARFLRERVDGLLAEFDDPASLTGYRTGGTGSLRLDECTDAATILFESWAWVRFHDRDRVVARHMVADMFNFLFKVGNANTVEFFSAILSHAGRDDILWIGMMLREGHHSFALKHSDFVVRLLERAREIDAELVEELTDQIAAAAMSGGWSGTVGEPMPRDLDSLEKSSRVLDGLSRLSPAVRLYDIIKRDSLRNIKASKDEALAMDEEL